MAAQGASLARTKMLHFIANNAPVRAAAAVVYDPTRAPLVQAIDEALSQADAATSLNAAAIVVRSSVAYPVTSTRTTISAEPATRPACGPISVPNPVSVTM